MRVVGFKNRDEHRDIFWEKNGVKVVFDGSLAYKIFPDEATAEAELKISQACHNRALRVLFNSLPVFLLPLSFPIGNLEVVAVVGIESKLLADDDSETAEKVKDFLQKSGKTHFEKDMALSKDRNGKDVLILLDASMVDEAKNV